MAAGPFFLNQVRGANLIIARMSCLCACQLYAPPPPVGNKRGMVGNLTISVINIPSPGAS